MLLVAMQEFSPADTLSTLIEVRRRIAGGDWNDMACGQGAKCVLAHIADCFGIVDNYSWSFFAVHRSREYALLRDTLPADNDATVGCTNDKLFRFGRHGDMLSWLDQAIAKAREDLGAATIFTDSKPSDFKTIVEVSP